MANDLFDYSLCFKQSVTADSPFEFSIGDCRKLRLIICGDATATLETSADGSEWTAIELSELPAGADLYEIEASIGAPHVRLTLDGDADVIAFRGGCRCRNPEDKFPVIKGNCVDNPGGGNNGGGGNCDPITAGDHSSGASLLGTSQFDLTGTGETLTAIDGSAVAVGDTVTDGNGNTLVIGSGGVVSFTGNTLGLTQFTYTITNACGESDTGTCTIVVVQGTPPEADLVTVKTLVSGDAMPAVGDTVTFQIVVTNNGPDESSGFTVTDQLPSGLTPTANNGTTPDGTYDPATGVWTVPGPFAVGDSATLIIEGTVDEGQGANTIINTTSPAIGAEDDPTTAGDDLDEQITIDFEMPGSANLVTVKTLISGDDTPAEGDTVTFQIVVTNNGPDEATGVSLVDVLPAGLTATANNGTISQGSYNDFSGQWDVGTLANGATATLTLEGTVDAGQGGNTITNTTSPATGDQTDPTTDGDDYEEEVTVEEGCPQVCAPDGTELCIAPGVAWCICA